MGNILIDEARLKALEDKIRRFESIQQGRGIDITKHPGGIVISAKPVNAPSAGKRSAVSFLAKIGTATPDGTGTNRWYYAFVEVTKGTGLAYSETSWVTGGRSGTAYNLKEVFNTSTEQVQGIGIDTANLPDGFTIKPVPPIAIVTMEERTFKNAEDEIVTEYWFSEQNAADGTCE